MPQQLRQSKVYAPSSIPNQCLFCRDHGTAHEGVLGAQWARSKTQKVKPGLGAPRMP